MKQTIKLGALVFMAALIIGALFIPEQAFADTYPGLKQNSIRLKVGESKTLKLKNAKGMTAKFYSDDPSIATVSRKGGKIKAKREGQVTILVIFDGADRDECRVFIDPASVAKKTMKSVRVNYGQTHIVVDRSVKDAPYEITISTKSKDENLNIMVYEETYGNMMSEVGKIDLNAKKLTLTATKKIILENGTYDEKVTIKVRTKDGKKTINRVDVI